MYVCIYLNIKQIFAVIVTLGPEGLVEVLLLLELCLRLSNLLLIFKDLHLSHFKFLHIR